MKVKGIHHISAIVKHGQENTDFYYGLLGLKMIGKAVNFDDANKYHLYFANEAGDVGSIMTFFPWDEQTTHEGQRGGGQVVSTQYLIPKGSTELWEARLNQFKVDYFKIKRFNEHRLVFNDLHGITNELIESDIWDNQKSEIKEITPEMAIKGFFGANMISRDAEGTKEFFINVLGLKLIDEDRNFYRFEMDDTLGKYIELNKNNVEKGRLSTGTVHHIAFTIEDDEVNAWKELLTEKGFNVSDVRDRKFFKSLYFREPGGTIIELATRNPGMTNAPETFTDEDGFTLPSFHEHLREELKKELYPIFARPITELKRYKYTNREQYESQVEHQKLLQRINELAKLAKERELTEEEIEERTTLRQKYVKRVVGTVKQNMDAVHIEDEEGNQQKLKRNLKK